MRITTVALILSCVMAVPAFAGKWAGDDGGWRYVRDDGSYQGDGWLEDKGKMCFKSGANAAISGDMLTTAGITVQTDMELLKNIGYEVKLDDE